MKLIFCYGDSLTRGSWDTQGGWAGRLRQELDKKYIQSGGRKYIQNLFNLGVSGRPVQEILTRFDNETQARTLDDCENLFIFMVGTVDASKDASSNRNLTSDSEWLDLLGQLVKKARQYGDKILFIGLPPVDEGRVNSEDRIRDLQRCYYNRRITEIDKLTTRFCEENNLPKVEINQAMLKMDYKPLLFDGIHPTDEGHEWIYRQIRPKLNDLLGS